MASTSARARSGSSSAIPCNSVTDWANRAVASRNPDGLRAGERQRGAGADGGDHRRRPDGGTSGRHGGQVSPLEDPQDLRGRRQRVAVADPADVREHDGALHRDHSVDGREHLGREPARIRLRHSTP